MPENEASYLTDPLKTVGALVPDQGTDKRIARLSDREVFPLILLEFFENFDSDDPYHLAAVSNLQSSMSDHLLKSDAEWFHVWSQSGRK